MKARFLEKAVHAPLELGVYFMGNLLTVFLEFLKIGAVMFGGHYAMIPLLRHDVIAKYGWISEEEFLDLWAVSESTPGPTALNAATYVGYKVAGFPGAVAATLAVILVPFIVILGIAFGVRKYFDSQIVRGVLHGLRGAIVALVASALASVALGVYKDLYGLQTLVTGGITVLSFVLVVFLKENPLVVLGAAALIGLVSGLLGLWG